jgi:hypothetical protein
MSSPDRIGRYRLERPLGSGAFGVVWLAHDDTLEAPVAVKVMAENWAYRLDLRERFLAEARLLRRASSNRVVQVFDIGELPDDRPYFVMEYADGGTLADRLADGPLPLPEALRLAAEAALGVAALHEAGIVHRDIKPSNVLVRAAPGGGDRLLVADLGLAKSLAHASGLTLVAGSAGYMSPEQAEPGVDGIDERADIYGLGALSYHLITGTVPGSPGKVVRPDRLCPELPDGVQRAVMRALEPDRERRWPSASQFAAVLEGLAQQAEQAGPRPGVRPGRRRTRRVAVAAGIALTVAAGAGAGITVTLGDRHASASMVGVRDTTGRIAVEVPAQWSGQLRGAGWAPGALGLSGTHEPGLVVASDLARWQDLDAKVSGVFVGLSEHGDVAAKVRAIGHSDCEYGKTRDFSDPSWHGQVRRWVACGNGGTSIEEIALTSTGGGAFQLYVEVRQTGGGDATDRVLDSLKVTK